MTAYVHVYIYVMFLTHTHTGWTCVIKTMLDAHSALVAAAPQSPSLCTQTCMHAVFLSLSVTHTHTRAHKAAL